MSKDERRRPPAGNDARDDPEPPQEHGADALRRIVRSDTLLGGSSQLVILHNDTLYFLRATRFGKRVLRSG